MAFVMLIVETNFNGAVLLTDLHRAGTMQTEPFPAVHSYLQKDAPPCHAKLQKLPSFAIHPACSTRKLDVCQLLLELAEAQ